MEKIKLGISACLLGESVRYNGGHKHNRYCTDQLASYFDFVPYCPEVAVGLGVPREPIRLVGDFDAPRVVGTVDPALDVTEPLQAFAEQVTTEAEHFCGFVFMKDSPSCGLYSAKVYTAKGIHQKKRAGVFAARLCERLPLLPVEEAGRLNDPHLRENFVARVYVYANWRAEVEAEPTPKGLVAFHSRHKYFAMAYSQTLYRQLGQIVAQAGKGEIKATAQSFITLLMSGTRKAPSRRGHVNVLYHLVGYLRKTVPGGLRQDLAAAIEDYRLGAVPLAVPMTLLKHYIDNYASDYIKAQNYLEPYPYELGLRNAI